jgi:catechol 2,3-dioxygenase-like lactoylglutathione lyase family enzyme
VRFHHVNLGVPVGALAAEIAFLTDCLGYRSVDPGEALRSRAHWFEADDGSQIHLSEDAEHRPAALAHVAVDVGSQLGELEVALRRRGYVVDAKATSFGRVALVRDPAGNRWELREHA